MRIDRFYNYYETHAYCKSEGICTEYFIIEMDRCKKKKRRTLAMLVAALVIKMGF